MTADRRVEMAGELAGLLGGFSGEVSVELRGRLWPVVRVERRFDLIARLAGESLVLVTASPGAPAYGEVNATLTTMQISCAVRQEDARASRSLPIFVQIGGAVTTIVGAHARVAARTDDLVGVSRPLEIVLEVDVPDEFEKYASLIRQIIPPRGDHWRGDE